MKNANNAVKAVGLLSGGLDSAIAARLLINQGIEVHAVHVSMPWGCGDSSRLRRMAEKLQISVKIIPLADD
ncbi:MAG: 7-cyano-7-deazaguanine synthase, partial [Candidatus Omnitrophota bacterium]